VVTRSIDLSSMGQVLAVVQCASARAVMLP
jgi:hypothetical protein